MKKYKVGIIGATGMVGQRFLLLVSGHPWFELTALAASAHSAGKPYRDAVAAKWHMPQPIPPVAADMTIFDAAADAERLAAMVDFVFCAVDMGKDEIRELEERYARLECPVVSNNSAHRWTPDVPMVVPEINPEHIRILDAQRRRLGTRRGFIAVKSNCSLQSYVPALHPLMKFGIDRALVCTYQAISGAGKTFETWPEMIDNVIPSLAARKKSPSRSRSSSGGTLRATASYAPHPRPSRRSVSASRSPTGTWLPAFCPLRPQSPRSVKSRTAGRITPAVRRRSGFPLHRSSFSTTLREDDRPQTKLDRMSRRKAVPIGRCARTRNMTPQVRLCLSHNTLRGAAGGAALLAELLCAEGYITAK